MVFELRLNPTPRTFALFVLQEEDSDDANEQAREEYGLPPKGALRWAVFEDQGEIRVMPGIRAKSSTKETDHVQVQEIKRGGRAKSHWTVKRASPARGRLRRRRQLCARTLQRGSPRPRAPRTKL